MCASRYVGQAREGEVWAGRGAPERRTMARVVEHVLFRAVDGTSSYRWASSGQSRTKFVWKRASVILLLGTRCEDRTSECAKNMTRSQSRGSLIFTGRAMPVGNPGSSDAVK